MKIIKNIQLVQFILGLFQVNCWYIEVYWRLINFRILSMKQLWQRNQAPIYWNSLVIKNYPIYYIKNQLDIYILNLFVLYINFPIFSNHKNIIIRYSNDVSMLAIVYSQNQYTTSSKKQLVVVDCAWKHYIINRGYKYLQLDLR